jgi:hypothetical protein
MGKARLPMSTTNRPRMSEADRQELRALFSQLADIQASHILEELDHQPQQANALKQDLWGLQARLEDIHADANT